eukprot:gene23640-biopygen22327
MRRTQRPRRRRAPPNNMLVMEDNKWGFEFGTVVIGFCNLHLATSAALSFGQMHRSGDKKRKTAPEVPGNGEYGAGGTGHFEKPAPKAPVFSLESLPHKLSEFAKVRISRRSAKENRLADYHSNITRLSDPPRPETEVTARWAGVRGPSPSQYALWAHWRVSHSHGTFPSQGFTMRKLCKGSAGPPTRGGSAVYTGEAWRREKRLRPRPVRVRFFELYRAPRVRSASGPVQKCLKMPLCGSIRARWDSKTGENGKVGDPRCCPQPAAVARCCPLPVRWPPLPARCPPAGLCCCPLDPLSKKTSGFPENHVGHIPPPHVLQELAS